jgi:hypothetical protein
MSWRTSILAVWLACAALAQANEYTNGTARLVVTNYPLAQAVLSKHCIFVTATGRVAIAWATAQNIMARPHLLDDIPRAYTASKPRGKPCGFTITPKAATSNVWHYVNVDKEPSDITEVARYGPDATCGEILFRVDGDRFFGHFQVVLVLRAQPDGPGKTNYAVDLWAYPENGLVRFFVRNLGLIERFFRKKTREIEEITLAVALQLSREQHAAISKISP